MTYMMDVALQFYARHGLAVFPCEAKRPLCKNGLKDATTDEEQIREWWTKWPKAQVGLPTGARNHLLVVDIDGQSGSEWVKKQDWPHTLTIESSPQHFQLYFKQPDGVTTKNSAGKIAPQVDIRGDGGYVIGAYSFHHKTGKAYLIVRSIDGLRTTENPVLPWAAAPDALLALVAVNGASPPISGNTDSIPQGRRHATMLALAGSFRARGFSPDTVLANLRIVNTQQCKPPLPDAELQKLAQFIGTKPAGFRNQRPLETSSEVVIQRFSEIEPETLRWLWPLRVALGKITLFVGDPGLGKSLVSIDVAARVSRGDLFPDSTPSEAGDVIILSAEDDARDTVAPRLGAARAELERVHRVKAVKVTLADGVPGESFFNLERDTEKLDEAIEKLPAMRLLVVDPISAYMGQVDTHRDADVRRILGPLAELASRRRIAVIGIMHLKKTEASALLRVSGSVGFVAAARCVWGFGEDPLVPGSRIMVAVKNNLAPLGSGLAYRIEAFQDVPHIIWLKDVVNADANEILCGEKERRAAISRRREAEAWVRSNNLSGTGKPVNEIKAAAAKAGIAWRTVERAKHAMPIRAIQREGQWWWVLE